MNENHNYAIRFLIDYILQDIKYELCRQDLSTDEEKIEAAFNKIERLQDKLKSGGVMKISEEGH